MKVNAEAKYLRVSPKKLKGLVATVVGLSPRIAVERLEILGEKTAKLMIKVIKSALSNAVNNFKLNEQKLRIKSVQVQKGAFFKRWQPVSRGMAHSIKKRTSHIKIILEEV